MRISSASWSALALTGTLLHELVANAEEDRMWTIDTPWFDVAVFMSLFATGSILFGHFEQHKPAWRRLLNPVIFLAVLISPENVAMSRCVGRTSTVIVTTI